MAIEVEYCAKRRRNELERVQTRRLTRGGTTSASLGSRLGSLESPCQKLAVDIGIAQNGVQGTMQRDRRLSGGGGEHSESRGNERTWGRERGANRSGPSRRFQKCSFWSQRLSIAQGGGEVSWRENKLKVQHVAGQRGHLPGRA